MVADSHARGRDSVPACRETENRLFSKRYCGLRESAGERTMNYLMCVFHLSCFFVLVLIVVEIVRGLKELWADFS